MEHGGVVNGLDLDMEIHLQLGSARQNRNGQVFHERLGLVEGIGRGIPGQLKEISTRKAAFDFYHTFLHQTFERYGLSAEQIVAWVLLAKGPPGTPAMQGPFPDGNDLVFKWRSMFASLRSACYLHNQKRCAECPKPVFLACLRHDHLVAALASRSLAPDAKVYFLDSTNPALAKKHDTAPVNIKNALFKMYQDVIAEQTASVLLVPPICVPLMQNNEVVGAINLFHNNAARGLRHLIGPVTTGPPNDTAIISTKITRAGQTFYVKGSVNRADGRSVMQLEGCEKAITRATPAKAKPQASPFHFAANLGRAEDGIRESKASKTPVPKPIYQLPLPPKVDEEVPRPVITRPRRVITDPMERPLAHENIPDENWDKGVPKPQTGTKGENESCLTCIYYKRSCKGTKVIGEKCEICSASPLKGHGGRKCYWADPSKNIRTYDDAREADPNARHIFANSRAGLEVREAKRQALAGPPSTERIRLHSEGGRAEREEQTVIDLSSVGEKVSDDITRVVAPRQILEPEGMPGTEEFVKSPDTESPTLSATDVVMKNTEVEVEDDHMPVKRKRSEEDMVEVAI